MRKTWEQRETARLAKLAREQHHAIRRLAAEVERLTRLASSTDEGNAA